MVGAELEAKHEAERAAQEVKMAEMEAKMKALEAEKQAAEDIVKTHGVRSMARAAHLRVAIPMRRACHAMLRPTGGWSFRPRRAPRP